MCDTADDCPACVGGDNEGDPCDPDELDDLCVQAGGACTGTATCIEVPSGCAISACCDSENNTCTTIPACTGADAGSFCTDDSDCGAICSNSPPFDIDRCDVDSECFRCVGGIVNGALCGNLDMCPDGTCDDGDNNPQTPGTCDGGERNGEPCFCQGGICDTNPTCNPGTCLLTCAGIPAVSEWGIVAMTLLLLAAGTVVLLRRRTFQLTK